MHLAWGLRKKVKNKLCRFELKQKNKLCPFALKEKIKLCCFALKQKNKLCRFALKQKNKLCRFALKQEYFQRMKNLVANQDKNLARTFFSTDNSKLKL